MKSGPRSTPAVDREVRLVEKKCLQGLRVLELSHFISAPYAGQMLADLGADVIKIELPGEGKGDIARKYDPMYKDMSLYFASYNRNKRFLTLNLKTPEGQEIFKELDELCKPETILASNTSSISITAIAAATKRPDKVLGMHFFNPAPAMKLVEVIRGARTSNESFKAVYDCAAEIGKSPVEVGEAPGFVVNRILFPMINEAIIVLENGIASKEDIDTAMMYGANHKMGPLALADLVGLDICLAIMETIFTETGDSKYRPALTMKKMVRAGLLGQKTGEGFYKYD